MAEFLRIDAPVLVTRTLRKTEITFTECRHDSFDDEKTQPIPGEDAYLVPIQVGSTALRKLWLDGRAIATEPLRPGMATFHDLRRSPSFVIQSTSHVVHMYIPGAAFDELAIDANSQSVGDLRFTPGVGVDDPVVRGLSLLLLPVFQAPEKASRLFVENVTLAMCAHIGRIYGNLRDDSRGKGDGLAPWQERRAKEIISASLDGNVAVAELAAECSLSVSSFSRAFRRSTGLSPHKWLLHRRVDVAKTLMCDRNQPLSHVALQCGFADQSHFTRVFVRITGHTPTAWRREKASGTGVVLPDVP